MTESTQECTLAEQFFSQFEEHCDSPYEPDMLRKKRLKAWDHLLEIGLPDANDEAFRYVRLDPLFTLNLEKAEACEIKRESLYPHILPEAKGSFLVFANGAFRPELSDISGLKDIVIMPLTQASRAYSSLLQGTWAKSLKEEVDPFVSLNNACHHEGLLLCIPPNKKLESHIQFHHIYDIDHPSWTMPRAQIALGKSSEAVFVDTSSGAYVNLFDNRYIDFILEDNATCAYSQYLHNSEAHHFSALRANLKRDAKFTMTSVVDAAFSRKSIRVQMAGENGHASLNGVNMLSGTKEGHIHVVVDHQEPHCSSMQLFKNVLHDSSRSSFEGKIWVRQKAQKTEAYQLNNNLILNSSAEALSKPNLEIFADDVKASHGATSGQLDKEQLFYLRTRGLSEDVARACLIQGFCQEVVNLMPNQTMRERAHELVISLYGTTRLSNKIN